MDETQAAESRRTTILWPPKFVERLDTAKAQTGLSWSAMIRAAVDAYLRGLGV